MRAEQKTVHVGNYNITQEVDGSINISGGYDTYVGWSGTFEAAVETVKGWL